MNLFLFDGEKWLQRMRQARYEKARSNTIGAGAFVAAVFAMVGSWGGLAFLLGIPGQKTFVPAGVIALIVFLLVYKSPTIAFLFNTLFQTAAAGAVGAVVGRIILAGILIQTYSGDFSPKTIGTFSTIIGGIVSGVIGWNTSKYIRF